MKRLIVSWSLIIRMSVVRGRRSLIRHLTLGSGQPTPVPSQEGNENELMVDCSTAWRAVRCRTETRALAGSVIAQKMWRVRGGKNGCNLANAGRRREAQGDASSNLLKQENNLEKDLTGFGERRARGQCVGMTVGPVVRTFATCHLLTWSRPLASEWNLVMRLVVNVPTATI